jgi:excisionase family DNA binding protein
MKTEGINNAKGRDQQTTGLPIYLTASDAATILRTSRKAVYAMIERRQLPGVKKLGRRVLIRSQDLVSWLDQQGAPSLMETKR